MAGSTVKSTTGNASRSRKRVEAAVLKRARDGSAFTLCEGCHKSVPVVLIDLHSCSLDSKIRMSLESQVVEKTVEINEKKRKPSSAAGKASKKSKGGAKKGKKRPQSAFFLFMHDFRLEFKVSHPDEKGAAAVGKAGGEKWRSMTDEEKKPYFDKAEELKAEFDNGEGSAENNVEAEEKVKEEEEKEVDQPSKPFDEDDDVVEDEQEEEKNDLDDDI